MLLTNVFLNRESVFDHDVALVSWPSRTFVPILRRILETKLRKKPTIDRNFVR